nr:hypothetical protein [Halostella pelagica]
MLSLGESALDDEMVTSLAGTGTALGEVAQTASDDDTRDGIETLLESIGEAERTSPEQVGPSACFADYVIKMSSTGWATC